MSAVRFRPWAPIISGLSATLGSVPRSSGTVSVQYRHFATGDDDGISQNPYGTWKALIRKQGWPTASRPFASNVMPKTGLAPLRTRWSAAYICVAPFREDNSRKALGRYLEEVTPTKKASTQKPNKPRPLRSSATSASIPGRPLCRCNRRVPRQAPEGNRPHEIQGRQRRGR